MSDKSEPMKTTKYQYELRDLGPDGEVEKSWFTDACEIEPRGEGFGLRFEFKTEEGNSTFHFSLGVNQHREPLKTEEEAKAFLKYIRDNSLVFYSKDAEVQAEDNYFYKEALKNLQNAILYLEKIAQEKKFSKEDMRNEVSRVHNLLLRGTSYLKDYREDVSKLEARYEDKLKDFRNAADRLNDHLKNYE